MTLFEKHVLQWVRFFGSLACVAFMLVMSRLDKEQYGFHFWLAVCVFASFNWCMFYKPRRDLGT